jgi:eukaryotic-like serine/threonine-protein kinase
MLSSALLGDMQVIDYIIESGRALTYPIYTGTYERVGHRELPGSYGNLDRVIKNAKEVRRSVDYLETRSDIDKSNIAYLGVSQGTAEGVIYAALEDRFKTVVFLDGGFFLSPTMPAKDQVNFVTR